MTDCIEWTGGHWSTGYPYRCATAVEIRAGSKRLIAVHREVWEKANGPIPPGRCVMHTCDNPGCINIDHLRVGTPADNQHDAMTKQRHTFGTRHSLAKLTDEAVRAIRVQYAAGGVTHRALAAEHGVSQGTVWKVLTGRGWSHVT